MRFGRCASIVIVFVVIVTLLAGCGAGSGEKPQIESNISDDTASNIPTETSKNESDNEDLKPGSEPNEERIQSYEVRNIIFSDRTSEIIWVYAGEWGEENGFRAAIDETGRIFSKIHSDQGNVLCSGKLICLFDKYLDSYNNYQIYTYDGADITGELLSESEKIWRVTQKDDRLFIWKYETVETYSSIKYILRVCDSSGSILLEIDSDEYPAIASALSADKYFPKQDQILHELGAGFYQIGDVFIDLNEGKLYGSEQYGLKNAVNVHGGYVFSGVECEDNYEGFLKRYKGLTVYKIGTDEPVYSWESDNEMFYSVNDNGIFMTYTRGEKTRMGVDGHYFEAAVENEPHRYYDGFSGKLLAQYDPASLGVEKIISFNGETAIAHMKGSSGTGFITCVDRNGDFLFEPLQSDNVLADWRDELNAICIDYSGDKYDGDGLYILDMGGHMKSLHITNADDIALTDSGKIAAVLDGVFCLYDIDGNKMC